MVDPLRFFTVHGVSIFNCMRVEQHVHRTKVQCLQIYGTLTQMTSQMCIHGMGEEMGMFSLDDSGVSLVSERMNVGLICHQTV